MIIDGQSIITIYGFITHVQLINYCRATYVQRSLGLSLEI